MIMETTTFTPLYDDDIISSISKLTSQSSDIKKIVFRAIVMDKELNKGDLQLYESYINEFLKTWTNRAEALKTKIKTVKVLPESNIRTIEYNYVKDYIFGNYDYASILKFTDGLFQGIESGKFLKNADVEDFKEHTIDKAFNHQPPAVADLVSNVVDSGLAGFANNPVDLLEAKKFDSVRTYNQLFAKTDRAQMFKAITKTLRYITSNAIIQKDLSIQDVKIFVSMLTNIIEYMTYTLATYAARVYIIHKYSLPFIRAYEDAPIKEIGKVPVTEASIASVDVSENPNGTISNTIRSMDEMIIRDRSKFFDVMEGFEKFLCCSGASSMETEKLPTRRKNYVNQDMINVNPYCNKLTHDPIYNLLSRFSFSEYSNRANDIVELNQNLKYYLFNSHQGIGGTNSDKQEMLQIISGMKCGETLKDHQVAAKDLYIFTFKIQLDILSAIDSIERWRKIEFEKPENGPAVLNSAAECMKFLGDLYSELMLIFISKARYLEMKINDLRSSEIDNIFDEIKLDIPGEKSDVSLTHNMMVAMPDSTRMPLDLVSMYELPTFESLQLYDEYVRSLPGMESVIYLSEAFDLSALINKLISRLKALSDQFMRVWADQMFNNAVKWVTDNETKLSQMNFTAAQPMNVFDYKENIGLPEGFENLTKNLNPANFDEKVLQSEETLNKFIRSLYPSENIASWFEKDPKSAAQKYMNLVLFQDEAQVTDKVFSEDLSLKGNDIKLKMVGIWVKTVKGAPGVNQGFQKISSELQSSVEGIKSKIVSLESKAKAANPGSSGNQQPATAKATTEATVTPILGGRYRSASRPTSTTSSSSTTTASTNQPTNDDSAQNQAMLMNKALVEINLVIDRIWGSITPMLISTTKNQYKYIRNAYNSISISK